MLVFDSWASVCPPHTAPQPCLVLASEDWGKKPTTTTKKIPGLVSERNCSVTGERVTNSVLQIGKWRAAQADWLVQRSYYDLVTGSGQTPALLILVFTFLLFIVKQCCVMLYVPKRVLCKKQTSNPLGLLKIGHNCVLKLCSSSRQSVLEFLDLISLWLFTLSGIESTSCFKVLLEDKPKLPTVLLEA